MGLGPGPGLGLGPGLEMGRGLASRPASGLGLGPGFGPEPGPGPGGPGRACISTYTVRSSPFPCGIRSLALAPDPPRATPRAMQCAASTSAVTAAHTVLPRSSPALPGPYTCVWLACPAARDACSRCWRIAPSACMHSCLGRQGIPRRRPGSQLGSYMACAPGTSLAHAVLSSRVYAVIALNPRARYQVIASVLPMSTSSCTTPTPRPWGPLAAANPSCSSAVPTPRSSAGSPGSRAISCMNASCLPPAPPTSMASTPIPRTTPGSRHFTVQI